MPTAASAGPVFVMQIRSQSNLIGSRTIHHTACRPATKHGRSLVCPVMFLQQCEVILQVATAEVEAACDEVGLQQQLQELESLILQRGLMGTDR
jgi:hypothetical protein